MNSTDSRRNKNTLQCKIKDFADGIRTVSVSSADLLLLQKNGGERHLYNIAAEYISPEHKDHINRDRSFSDSEKITVDENMLICGDVSSAAALMCRQENVNVIPLSDSSAPICSDGKSTAASAEAGNDIPHKLAGLLDSANSPLNIVVLGSSADEADIAAEALAKYGQILSVTQHILSEPDCYNLCCRLVNAADLYGDKHDVKVTVKNPRAALIQLKLAEPQMTTAENNELKILKHWINYRIPLIEQSAGIRKTLAEKTFIKNDMLFIPKNFYQNRCFSDILAELGIQPQAEKS